MLARLVRLEPRTGPDSANALIGSEIEQMEMRSTQSRNRVRLRASFSDSYVSHLTLFMHLALVPGEVMSLAAW